MRTFSLFAIVIFMSTFVVESTASAQTIPAPQAVSDPKQIKSTPNAQVEPKSLTIEKLYMTRQVGRPTWSPDGTPQDKRNSNPIWSKDGKSFVYTEEQAKGTDSNIFIADVAAATSTLLTPHEGEQIYSANDISPDGKHVLITSNAGNGYDNIAMLDIATN